jgi:hypothetical protein
LPEALLRENGFSDDTWGGNPAPRITYRDADGAVILERHRFIENGKRDFRNKRGSKQQLYGLHRLRPTEPVVLVEGETDALALWTAGVNALGVPGCEAWKDKLFAPLLKDCPTIFVHVEPDQGGEEFRERFEKSTLRDRCGSDFTLVRPSPRTCSRSAVK